MCIATLYSTDYWHALQRIEKPLSNLISDITVPPSLATAILDSHVDESWISTIDDFERRLVMTKARSRVKAARDLGEVAEGLRIVVRDISTALRQERVLTIYSGCDEVASFLSCSLSTYTRQCYHEYAGHTDLCSAQIQTTVLFSSASSS